MDVRYTVISPVSDTASHTLRLRSLERFLFLIFSSSFSRCSWAAASARSLVLRSCLAACAMVPLLLPLLLLLLLLLQSASLQPSSRLHHLQSCRFPLPVSLCPQSPVTHYLLSGGHHDMCANKAGSEGVCVPVAVCVGMTLRQPQDSLQQPQRKMLQLVVLMLLPVPRLLLIHTACTALNRLPSPFLLSYLLSYLLSPLSPPACTDQSRRPRWGSCCRAPSFYLSNVLLFLLLQLFLQFSSRLNASLSQQLLLPLA